MKVIFVFALVANVLLQHYAQADIKADCDDVKDVKQVSIRDRTVVVNNHKGADCGCGGCDDCLKRGVIVDGHRLGGLRGIRGGRLGDCGGRRCGRCNVCLKRVAIAPVVAGIVSTRVIGAVTTPILGTVVTPVVVGGVAVRGRRLGLGGRLGWNSLYGRRYMGLGALGMGPLGLGLGLGGLGMGHLGMGGLGVGNLGLVGLGMGPLGLDRWGMGRLGMRRLGMRRLGMRRWGKGRLDDCGKLIK